MTNSPDRSSLNTRSSDYPLTAWQSQLKVAFNHLTGRPRSCGLNAFRCLQRSWTISELDPEMALFRALTAQEEASTALIVALKHRRYPGSERLNHWKHSHKVGLATFVRIIEWFLADIGFTQFRMGLYYVDSLPRIDVELPIDSSYWAKPDQPLNVVTHELIGERPKIARFERQLREYAEKQGQQDFAKAVNEEANLRNRLLYATNEGVTAVTNVDLELVKRGRSVSTLLGLTLCILQTPNQQLFAIQVLEAFLASVKALPNELFDFDEALPPGLPWL